MVKSKASGAGADSASRAPRAHTTPDKPGNTRRELVEQSIFDHATRLFAERGYAGTSFQDIADAVGLTRPALYHYVDSKEGLLAKLVTETTEDAAAAIKRTANREDLDAAAKVHEIIYTGVRRQAEFAERFKLLIRSEADLPAEVTARHESSRRLILRTLTKVIEDGIHAGVFRPLDPRVAALAVLGINNWVAWWYHPDPKAELDQVCNQLADMAVASLTSPDGRAAAAGGVHGVLGMVREDLDRLERLLDDGSTRGSLD